MNVIGEEKQLYYKNYFYITIGSGSHQTPKRGNLVQCLEPRAPLLAVVACMHLGTFSKFVFLYYKVTGTAALNCLLPKLVSKTSS